MSENKPRVKTASKPAAKSATAAAPKAATTAAKPVGIIARQRIDTWLWAARFFKTRSLCADAIDGGKVKWNGISTKPSREVRVGDELEITSGEQRWTVIVKDMHALRRPAPEARTMYEETEASLAARIQASEQRKLSPVPGANLRGRPTKKDARQIKRFKDG